MKRLKAIDYMYMIKDWGRVHKDLGTKWTSTPSTYQRYQASTL